jgi:hypothetical protein
MTTMAVIILKYIGSQDEDNLYELAQYNEAIKPLRFKFRNNFGGEAIRLARAAKMEQDKITD